MHQDLELLRAQLCDAIKDTLLWGQADPSHQERLYLIKMQTVLNDWLRCVENQISGYSRPSDDQSWDEYPRHFLYFYEKASTVRGQGVGRHLGRLSEEVTLLAAGQSHTSPTSLRQKQTAIAAEHSFRWEDLDQRLLSAKLQELAEEMQKLAAKAERKAHADTQKTGNSAGFLPRLFEVQRRLTDEWAKKLYDVHCEVWRIQGHAKCADFIRAVGNKAVRELIAARKGVIGHSAQLWCTRTGSSQYAAALGHWNRMMDSLATQWSRRLEIEARTSEHRAAQEASHQQGGAGLLSLSTGMQSSGDPVERNPFQIDDPRHGVWNDATRAAEEKWCRLGSQSESSPLAPPDVLIESVCKRLSDKFDVWAERGVHVVWSHAALLDYDQWLVNYAEAWLQDVSARRLYSGAVPLHHLLAALRLRLLKRVNWWKAEARRYLAEQKTDLAKGSRSLAHSLSELSSKGQASAVGSDVKLANPSKFPTMTVSEVMAHLGISRSSVYRYINEGRLDRPGLNKKAGKRSKTLILTRSVQKMLQEAED